MRLFAITCKLCSPITNNDGSGLQSSPFPASIALILFGQENPFKLAFEFLIRRQR